MLSSLKDKGEKPDDYFLMVDEIDSLQLIAVLDLLQRILLIIT